MRGTGKSDRLRVALGGPAAAEIPRTLLLLPSRSFRTTPACVRIEHGVFMVPKVLLDPNRLYSAEVGGGQRLATPNEHDLPSHRESGFVYRRSIISA